MKYQVGDEIVVLHSNEEGRVIDIINDKMVMVEVRGVKFPAYMDQIDFPYFKRFTEKKLIPPRKEKKYVEDIKREKPTAVERKADGVWITFLPVMETDEFGDEIVELLKMHLVNRSAENLHFQYNLHFFGKSEFELKSTVPAFSDFYLHDIPFEDMNDSPSFEFEFSPVIADKKKADYYEASLKLKPKQLFTRISEIREKNEATFSYKLFDQYPDKQADAFTDILPSPGKGQKIYDLSQLRQHLEPARSVIDLHIEKLSNDWKHLSNFEILTLQLRTFEKYYELALVHHQPSLIVIHGLGSGKLRDELHDLLRLKKEVRSFVNQYDPRFGYGATEIFFQY
jgi:Smr domain